MLVHTSVVKCAWNGGYHKGGGGGGEGGGYIYEVVPLVEFLYLVLTRMPGGSYLKAIQVSVVVSLLPVERYSFPLFVYS